MILNSKFGYNVNQTVTIANEILSFFAACLCLFTNFQNKLEQFNAYQKWTILSTKIQTYIWIYFVISFFPAHLFLHLISEIYTFIGIKAVHSSESCHKRKMIVTMFILAFSFEFHKNAIHIWNKRKKWTGILWIFHI